MKRTVAGLVFALAVLLVLLFEPWRADTPEAPRPSTDASAPSIGPVPESGPPDDAGDDGAASTEVFPVPPFLFRVTDLASGEPIEGAVIEPEADPDEELPPLRDGPAQTDAEGLGRFVVDHPGYGAVSFRARKPGYLLVRGIADRGELTEIRMARGTRVTGRIVHAITGQAVEGAVVRAFTRAEDWREACGRATTDGEGAFRLDAVPPDQKVVVVARARGLVPARVDRSFPKEGSSIEIRVGGGGIVQGTVRRPDGRPAAGTVIWLVPAGYPLPPRRSDGHWLAGSQLELLVRFLHPRVTTNDRGAYRFEGVAPGTERIVVARLSEFRECESEPVRFERDGDEAVRDIRIPEPAKVTLTIRDDRGEIIPHPQVDFRSERVWFDARQAGLRLDDGRIHLPEAMPGTWKLRAWIPGAEAMEREVTLSPGEHEEIEFRVPPSPVLEGVVLDPAGRPVFRARVVTQKPPWISGMTDRSGRFRLTGLAPEPVDLEVSPGFVFPEPEERPLCPVIVRGVRPGSEALRVELPYAGFLTGRVPGFEPGARFRLGIFSRMVTSQGELILEEGGAFRTGAPRPGTPFLLKIACPGRPACIVECAALKAGEDFDLGEIRFPSSRVLAGRVVGPDDAPVEGAEVRLVERWLDTAVRTDEEGRFRFRDMPARPIWTLVKAKGWPWHFVILDPPGEGPGPVIRMTAGGTLRATVENADGSRPAKGEYLGRWLVSHPLDGDLDELCLYFAFEGGAFTHRLQPGRYRFRVWDPDHARQAEAEFEIGEGSETTHRFRLEPK